MTYSRQLASRGERGLGRGKGSNHLNEKLQRGGIGEEEEEWGRGGSAEKKSPIGGRRDQIT